MNTKAFEGRVRELVGQMTLEEKISQMIHGALRLNGWVSRL